MSTASLIKAKQLAITTDVLVATSRLATKRVGSQLWQRVVEAWRVRDQFIETWDLFEELYDPLRITAVAAFVGGIETSRKLANQGAIKALALAHGDVFEDIRAQVKDRAAGRVNVDVLEQRYGTTALRVLKGASDQAEAKLRKTMDKLLTRGAHVEEGIDALARTVKAAGLSPVNPWQLETMVRTQTQLAYGAARWRADQDEAIQEILWGYEYVTVGDDRVRDEHAVLDGVVLPKDDPFWKRFWPPNGWNCRCTTLPVFDEGTPVLPPTEMEDGTAVRPDEDFDFNPGRMSETEGPTAPASTENADSLMREGLKRGWSDSEILADLRQRFPGAQFDTADLAPHKLALSKSGRWPVLQSAKRTTDSHTAPLPDAEAGYDKTKAKGPQIEAYITANPSAKNSEIAAIFETTPASVASIRTRMKGKVPKIVRDAKLVGLVKTFYDRGYNPTETLRNMQLVKDFATLTQDDVDWAWTQLSGIKPPPPKPVRTQEFIDYVRTGYEANSMLGDILNAALHSGWPTATLADVQWAVMQIQKGLPPPPPPPPPPQVRTPEFVEFVRKGREAKRMLSEILVDAQQSKWPTAILEDIRWAIEQINNPEPTPPPPPPDPKPVPGVYDPTKPKGPQIEAYILANPHAKNPDIAVLFETTDKSVASIRSRMKHKKPDPVPPPPPPPPPPPTKVKRDKHLIEAVRPYFVQGMSSDAIRQRLAGTGVAGIYDFTGLTTGDVDWAVIELQKQVPVSLRTQELLDACKDFYRNGDSKLTCLGVLGRQPKWAKLTMEDIEWAYTQLKPPPRTSFRVPELIELAKGYYAASIDVLTLHKTLSNYPDWVGIDVSDVRWAYDSLMVAARTEALINQVLVYVKRGEADTGQLFVKLKNGSISFKDVEWAIGEAQKRIAPPPPPPPIIDYDKSKPKGPQIEAYILAHPTETNGAIAVIFDTTEKSVASIRSRLKKKGKSGAVTPPPTGGGLTGHTVKPTVTAGISDEAIIKRIRAYLRVEPYGRGASAILLGFGWDSKLNDRIKLLFDAEKKRDWFIEYLKKFNAHRDEIAKRPKVTISDLQASSEYKHAKGGKGYTADDTRQELERAVEKNNNSAAEKAIAGYELTMAEHEELLDKQFEEVKTRLRAERYKALPAYEAKTDTQRRIMEDARALDQGADTVRRRSIIDTAMAKFATRKSRMHAAVLREATKSETSFKPAITYKDKHGGRVLPKDHPSYKATEEASAWLQGTCSEDCPIPVKLAVHEEVGRAYARVGSASVHVDKYDDAGTLIHEFAHHIEADETKKQLIRGFLAKRTRGILPKDLGYGGKHPEVAVKDDFYKAYCGKYYPDCTEVTSMGFQRMYSDPEDFAATDPEYFKLILALMQGLL